MVTEEPVYDFFHNSPFSFINNAVREFEEFKDITGIGGLIRFFALPSMFALCTAQEVPKLMPSVCMMTCAVSSLYCTFSY